MASRSSLSLPSIPQCPFTQTNRTLLRNANDFSAFIASATRLVVALKAETALMAAKLSQHIATDYIEDKGGQNCSLFIVKSLIYGLF